jgi:hypothetical protein
LLTALPWLILLLLTALLASALLLLAGLVALLLLALFRILVLILIHDCPLHNGSARLSACVSNALDPGFVPVAARYAAIGRRNFRQR